MQIHKNIIEKNWVHALSVLCVFVFQFSQASSSSFIFTPAGNYTEISIAQAEDIAQAINPLASLSGQDLPLDGYPGIRLYPVPGKPDHKYLWECENIKNGESARPKSNKGCYPFVYQMESGQAKFYFDRSWKGCEKEEECGIDRLAFVNIESLARLEHVLKSAKEQSRLVVGALSAAPLFLLTIPIYEVFAAAALGGFTRAFAWGAVRGYVAPSIGGAVLVHSAAVEYSLLGFAFMLDIFGVGIAEEVAQHQFVNQVEGFGDDPDFNLFEKGKVVLHLSLRVGLDTYKENLLAVLNNEYFSISPNYGLHVLQAFGKDQNCKNCFSFHGYLKNEIISQSQRKTCQEKSCERKMDREKEELKLAPYFQKENKKYQKMKEELAYRKQEIACLEMEIFGRKKPKDICREPDQGKSPEEIKKEQKAIQQKIKELEKKLGLEKIVR